MSLQSLFYVFSTVKKMTELKSRGVKMLPSKDNHHKISVCKLQPLIFYLFSTTIRYFFAYLVTVLSPPDKYSVYASVELGLSIIKDIYNLASERLR